MEQSTIQILLDRYLAGTCSEQEKEQVETWLEQQDAGINEWTTMDNAAKAAWMASLYQDIRHSITRTEDIVKDEPPVIPLYRRSFLRIAVAAAVILLTGTVAYVWLARTPKTDVAKTNTDPISTKDVLPGGNKAILTLADNSTIILDNAANGAIAQQGNSKVIKQNNGQLIYTQENKNGGNPLTIDHSPLTWNTLTTPRGGQYQLVLPDGSKVWLNAASSITYPAAFTGKERRVRITGEAYFEVVHNAKIPFTVEKGNMVVEVLGTHFNVNAYDDEADIKTTLLEGRVKVSVHKPQTTNFKLLAPGQQVSISQSSQLSQPIPVLTDDVMAWKNGLFHFENADIETVMRQVSRWYDVEIVYKRNTEKYDPLFVEVPRNTNLSELLKALKLAGGARFSIEGKKIIVE